MAQLRKAVVNLNNPDEQAARASEGPRLRQKVSGTILGDGQEDALRADRHAAREATRVAGAAQATPTQGQTPDPAEASAQTLATPPASPQVSDPLEGPSIEELISPASPTLTGGLGSSTRLRSAGGGLGSLGGLQGGGFGQGFAPVPGEASEDISTLIQELLSGTDRFRFR